MQPDIVVILFNCAVVVDNWAELRGEAARFPNAEERRNVIKALKEAAGGSVFVSNEAGRTILHYLAMNDAPDLMESLIVSGISVDCLDSNQQTPLHLAVTGCCTQAAVRLIECGADVHRVDIKHQTPWHTAFTISADNDVRLKAKKAIIIALAKVTIVEEIRGCIEVVNVLREMKEGKLLNIV